MAIEGVEVARKKSKRRSAGVSGGRTARVTGESTGKNSAVTGDGGTGAGAEITGDVTGEGAGDRAGEINERGVGVLPVSNTVEIDEASLMREADAAVLSAAPQPGEAPLDGAPTAGELLPQGEAWGPFLKTAVAPLLFGFVMPQWQVTPEEQSEWTDALGQCCDQLFPGGPEGRYACWVRLILGTVAIGGVRFVTNGGKFPQFGPPRAVRSEEKTGSAQAADAPH
jgi:hypothetical protein